MNVHLCVGPGAHVVFWKLLLICYVGFWYWIHVITLDSNVLYPLNHLSRLQKEIVYMVILSWVYACLNLSYYTHLNAGFLYEVNLNKVIRNIYITFVFYCIGLVQCCYGIFLTWLSFGNTRHGPHQCITCRSWFFSLMWIPGVEPRSLVLAEVLLPTEPFWIGIHAHIQTYTTTFKN